MSEAGQVTESDWPSVPLYREAHMDAHTYSMYTHSEPHHRPLLVHSNSKAGHHSLTAQPHLSKRQLTKLLLAISNPTVST